jgi:hypothetical protein
MSESESEAGASDAGIATPPSPTRMVRLEQQVGWMVVAGTAAAVVYAWFGGPVNGKAVPFSAIALGLVMTAALGAAVWYGRRLIAAFAAMAAGAVISYSLISIFCLAFGGFLLFRNTLAQRKLAMARPRRPPRAARSRSSKAAAAASSSSSSEADGVRRPSANRRYTPPKSKTPRRGR